VDADDLRSLAGVMMYGGDDTRRALARRVSADDGSDLWRVLVATVRSDEPGRLRARCLEVLGFLAAHADHERAALILAALLAPLDGTGQGPA